MRHTSRPFGIVRLVQRQRGDGFFLETCQRFITYIQHPNHVFDKYKESGILPQHATMFPDDIAPNLVMRICQRKALRMSGMSIFVKKMTGQVYRLDVDSSDTIEVVKQKIQDTTGIVPAKQRLKLGGKWLEDQKTLADYGIIAQTTIHLITPLK